MKSMSEPRAVATGSLVPSETARRFIQGRRFERDRVIAWLNRRCEYGPPCGKCHYCAIALTLMSPNWIADSDSDRPPQQPDEELVLNLK